MKQTVDMYKGYEIIAVVNPTVEIKTPDGKTLTAKSVDEARNMIDVLSAGSYAGMFAAEYPESALLDGDKLRFCRVCIYGGKCPYGHDHAIMAQTGAIGRNHECRRCWESSPEVR